MSTPFNRQSFEAAAQVIELTRPETEVLAELDAACIRDGLLQPMPAAFYAARPQVELTLWCVRRGFYNLPTVELIDWLRDEIGGELAIEIACGHGAIGRALHIPFTDSRWHDNPEVRAHYAMMKQAPTICPDDVVQMEALAAIDRYEPTVVVCAWGTWKHDPARPGGGSHVGIPFRRVIGKPSVQKLIMIAHERVHAPIDILELDHHTIRKPWLYGRSMDTERNVIWVWGRRSDDPGRDLIMKARDAGLLTAAEAESLDAWADALVKEYTLGRIDEAELARQLRARLEADIARRGQA